MSEAYLWIPFRNHLGLPNFPVYTQTFPVQPERLKWVSRVHLWASGMSLSDCDTPPSLNLQSSIQSSTPEPLPLAQGSLKWFLLRENPPSAALCEKIKDVWVLFSTVQWKVEKRAGKSRRMPFIRNVGVPLWMAEGCYRPRVKDNIGLNPKRNVSTERVTSGEIQGRLPFTNIAHHNDLKCTCFHLGSTDNKLHLLSQHFTSQNIQSLSSRHVGWHQPVKPKL